jgi:hypothetical protein
LLLLSLYPLSILPNVPKNERRVATVRNSNIDLFCPHRCRRRRIYEEGEQYKIDVIAFFLPVFVEGIICVGFANGVSLTCTVAKCESVHSDCHHCWIFRAWNEFRKTPKVRRA